MLPLLIGICAAYIYACIRIGRWYSREAKEYGALRSIIEKPVVHVLLYGWGFMGTQGFALPAPIVWAAIHNDYKYWKVFILYPAMLWLGVFVTVEIARALHKRYRSRNEPVKP
jgi:hypothetical protein